MHAPSSTRSRTQRQPDASRAAQRPKTRKTEREVGERPRLDHAWVVHVGEIELRGEDIAGIAVHVAARVMGEANGDEVLVSRTARDLTAGSGLEFTDRGSHTLGRARGLAVYALT